MRIINTNDPMNDKMENEQILYQGEIPMKVKGYGHGGEWQEVWVTFRKGLKHGGHVLGFQLTMEKDLYFLYTLELNETDFVSLKHDQHLIVDLDTFPLQVIELLQKCDECHHDGSGKFSATLQQQPSSSSSQQKGWILSIVETNPFKHLIHLTLNFVAGNDGAIKSYLATQVKELKEMNSHLNTSMKSLQTTLEDRLHESLHSIERMKEDMQTTREDYMVMYKEEKLRSEKEKEEWIHRQEEEMKRWHERKSELEYENKLLIELRYQLEANVREAQKRLTDLEKENNGYKEESMRLKSEHREWEVIQVEQDKEINQFRIRYTALEQQLKDKIEVVTKTTQLLNAANEQKNKNEEAMDMLKAQNTRLEDALRRAKEEITKGNDIIQKLQTELRGNKSKLKSKEATLSHHDKLFDEKLRTIENLEKEIVLFKEKLAERDKETEDLKINLHHANYKLEEDKQVIETNENIIAWLNKQMNEGLQSRHPINENDYTHSSRYHDSKRVLPTSASGFFKATTAPMTSKNTARTIPLGISTNTMSLPNELSVTTSSPVQTSELMKSPAISPLEPTQVGVKLNRAPLNTMNHPPSVKQSNYF